MRISAIPPRLRPLVLGAVLLGSLAPAVMAQGTPATGASMPGAMPPNETGAGGSQPMNSQASNIVPQDSAGTFAPGLPTPPLSENARPTQFLRSAQGALAAGRTGEAQQALEMAQTRLLDRSVPLGQTNDPSRNPAVREISQALQALGSGDRTSSMRHIQAAIDAASREGL
ncbi:MAG: hypothetical protein AB7F35_24295 [Acetobacteraceae bacterium]